MIYLDNAATTLQKPRSVEAAMVRAMRTCASPGRGGHAPAMAAAEVLYKCRERAARLFNVDNMERVAVTFNATHGLNIAIRSLVGPGSRVVISGYEHNSVVRPLHALGAEVTAAGSPVFDRDAAIAAFERAVDGKTDAVICTHVSNVFGFILPVYEIGRLCRERGVPFIVDASQSAGALEVDAGALGADFIAMPGHKGLYGPQGTGLLIASGRASPVLFGGSGSESRSPDMPMFLPDRLEAGTHNIPGAAGLAEGLDFVLRRGVGSIAAHERLLTRRLAKSLAAIPGVRVFTSDDAQAQAGVLSFDLDSMTPEEAGERLDGMGFAVRAGLHCSPLAHATVGTIRRGTVRASFSAFSTAEEADAFAAAVEKLSRGR